MIKVICLNYYQIIGYAQYKFNRTDIKCGSYGGKKTAT